MLMHESLIRQENMLTELGATDLLSQIRLKAMVTLMVENFFSLMRKDDPMQTQLEYGIRRASCIRELQKKMCRGQFHYYTGPKSYYPNKVIDASPPPISHELQLETAMEKLSLVQDKQQLREFATTFGKRVRQHTVRDKAKRILAIYCTKYRFTYNHESQAPQLQPPPCLVNPILRKTTGCVINKLTFSTKYCSTRRGCLL